MTPQQAVVIANFFFYVATFPFSSSSANLAGDKKNKPKIMNCPHCGKILPIEFWHDPVEKIITKCPRCGGTITWKDAKRYTSAGVIQRYSCRDCGCRFS